MLTAKQLRNPLISILANPHHSLEAGIVKPIFIKILNRKYTTTLRIIFSLRTFLVTKPLPIKMKTLFIMYIFEEFNMF